MKWTPKKATVNEYCNKMFGNDWWNCKTKAGNVYFIMDGVDVYLSPYGNVIRVDDGTQFKSGMSLSITYHIYGESNKTIFIGGE